MKKLTLLLSGIFFCLFSFAQSPQVVPGNYQHTNVPSFTLGSLGESVGLGGSLVFAADNSIWITDGSLNGTLMLKQFMPNDSLQPTGMKELNGNIYFFADDGSHGYELWSTDGTAAGTVLVKDINPGSGSSIELVPVYTEAFIPHKIEVFNDHIYFAANDGLHGSELWKSDGTEQGTTMFQDLYPGSDDGLPYNVQIVAAGNKLFFVGKKPDPLFTCLLATDGTIGGTNVCLDTIGTMINETIVPFGNKVIFSTDYFPNTYISDGTEVGTFVIVPELQTPRDVAILNNKAYFFAGYTPVGYMCHFMETDGTLAGTHIVYDSVGGGIIDYENRKTFFIQELNNQLYFSGWKSGTSGLWRSDGTNAGTYQLNDLDIYGNAYHITPFNNKLYFKAYTSDKHDLWYTDGTSSGTQMFNMPGTVINDGNTLIIRKYFRRPMISTGNALYFYNTYDSSVKARIYKLDLFPVNTGNQPQISSIDIYPNPSQGIITIDAENAKSISIHSINGSLIYKNENISDIKHTVDTHNFPTGTYTITTLLSDGTKRYCKFVKQ